MPLPLRAGRGLGIRRRRALVAAVVAVATPAALIAATLPAGATSRPGAPKASGLTTYTTYTSTITIPAPPAANFAGAQGGGDGWGLGFTTTRVYNVFHHSGFLGVACHNLSDASPCWTPAQAPNGFKTVTDSSGGAFDTSSQPGLWVDQARGHLYVFASHQSDGTAGVVCIDTNAPASDTDPFCGYTPLTAAGDAMASGIAQVSNPVLVGSDWYSFNYVDGAPTGSKDELLCFDVQTAKPCSGQPFAVDYGLGAGDSVIAPVEPEPSIAASGNEILVPTNLQPQGAAPFVELGCFDVATAKSCSGRWPVADTFNYPDLSIFTNSGGAAFPMLNAAGTPTGFCVPTTGDPCLSLAGAAVPTPKGLLAAVTPNADFDGAATLIGPRVYLPDGTFGGPPQPVACFDWSTDQSCASFPLQLQNLDILYSLEADPNRPTCLFVNSHAGQFQIQSFDAYTGGPCAQAPLRVLASAVVAPGPLCAPTQFTSIQVVTPARDRYSSGNVAFENSDGNPLVGVPSEPLDSTGSVNLLPFHLSGLPQFVISLVDPPAVLPAVVVRLSWMAADSPSCLQPGTTAVTPENGYRLEGGDGGVFDFHVPYRGSVGFPSPPGLGLHIFNFVGLAATHDGYWLVQRNGGVFTFGKVPFLGSLPSEGITVDDIVGIAATPDAKGYWIVGADGTVYDFGDAPVLGTLAQKGVVAHDVVAIVSPDLGGYWLLRSNGRVYDFGDARALASCGAGSACGPAGGFVGFAGTQGGGGYWLVSTDGGVFGFGNAKYHGSCPLATSGCSGATQIVGLAPTFDDGGYWIARADGSVYSFGDAKFFGSCLEPGSGCTDLIRPIVAVASS